MEIKKSVLKTPLAWTFIKLEFLDIANFLMFLVFDKFVVFLPIKLILIPANVPLLKLTKLLELLVLIEKGDVMVFNIKVSEETILLKLLMNY